MRQSRPRKADATISEAWRSFWESPEGKAAIGTLFKEFGFYGSPAAGADLSRAWGQRDVLVRISQMLNLKPEAAPDHDRDMGDVFDNITRQ